MNWLTVKEFTNRNVSMLFNHLLKACLKKRERTGLMEFRMLSKDEKAKEIALKSPKK